MEARRTPTSHELARLGAMTGAEEALLLTVGDQRVLWSNDAAGRLFEAGDDELTGRPMREILAMPPGKVVEACRSVTALGHLSGKVDIVTAAGRTVPTSFRAFSLGGDLHVSAFRTVSARRSPSPDRARRTTPTPWPVSAELAAAVGHEIRGPLATALTYMAIVQKQIDDGARRGPMRSALATARQEISRIERLVSRVTEMQSFGFPVMRPRLVDVGRVVSEAVARSVPIDLARTVRVEIGRGNLTDWWDDGAVEQIVQNLLSNALKFGEGRPVHVALDCVEHRARLSVRDQGGGLPASEQAQIFGRRVRSPLSRAPGMGLGLWFVRTLAEAHRGVVAVRSRPGEGATFTVSLKAFRPAH